MKQKPLVIYHANCYDGFTAAWVFKRFRGDADFVPGNYGQDPPDCKGRDVWLLDFSYPRDVMLKSVIAPSERTIVLDHHKTAEAALDGILQDVRKKGLQRTADQIVFDMSRSGAGITFDFLEDEFDKRHGVHTPRLQGYRKMRIVDYVEDRDLWKFQYPQTKAVLAWMATQPMTFEAWDSLAVHCETASDGMVPAVTAGKHVMSYIENYGKKAMATARMEKLDGHTVPTMNIAYLNCSDHLDSMLSATPDAPFVVSYFRRADGKWQFSLRSREDFDVSEVAKKFGGGGHKQAAGFEVEVFPWDRIQPKE